MKNFLLAIFLLITTAPAVALNNWSYMACDGTDTAGYHISLSAYSDSNTVTINGYNLRIVGKTRNGNGIVTENFVSVAGKVVYDSLVPFSNTGLNLYQFNAVTQNLLAQATLYCNFYGNNGSKANVINQQIFHSLKSSTNKLITESQDHKRCMENCESAGEMPYVCEQRCRRY